MNKEAWVRPVTTVEQFAANEYVAACGEGGKTYNFECNAKSSFIVPFPVYAYNGPRGSAEVNYLTNSYYPCGDKHEASSTDVFLDGFIDYNFNGKEDTGESVIIWRGEKGNNVHCTTKLDISSWEVARS